ncbi:MAG: host specificity factor TipJ family phage tail protein [Treponema sp.]|nr:host specificity factor TipJ family phage tail protein [Treponema sp.]
MSVKIIAQLHPLKSNQIKVTSSSKPISEIIKDLNSGFPLSQARVCRNGEIIKDFSIIARNGDTLWIKFIPHGSNEDIGIGMKAGGWGLAALGVALGFILGWTGIGLTVGAALIGTGVSMALGGMVMLNIDIPPLEDREKPEANQSIRGSKNQARPLGRIPVLFGRHRIYPDLAANQYTKINGNQQYFYQLFCGGYKDCVIDIDSIKLGDIPIIDLSHTKDINKILAGTDPAIRLEIIQDGKTSEVYPYCVHEEILNAPLQHQIEDAEGNKISGEIIRYTPDNTDEINVDIFFHNGLGRYNDEGKVVGAEVTVEAWYKNENDPDLQSYWLTLGNFNSAGKNNIISGSELKTKRLQVTKDKLPRGKYAVKIVRVTPDAASSKIVDAVHVGSIRSTKTERPIRAERQKNLTIIAMRVMATARINGMLDSFNYIATSKLPVFSPNGTGPLYWLNTEETQNPASMLMYALRGLPAQQRVDDDDIDWMSIEKFYTWCEDHKYTCNAYMTEAVTIAELIRMIGNTARADILRIDSKIAVVQDIERESPVQLFTPKNTIGYSITMFNADIPDAIALRFIDEKAGFAHNESVVCNTPDGNKKKDPETGKEIEPETIQKVDLWGITDDEQVRRIGMYNYGCLKNRPFIHSIDVDIEYLLCNKGDWIQYAGDIALTGSVQGRIKGTIWADNVCIGIDTDEPVIMTEGQQHAVRIRLSKGNVILKDVAFITGQRREKAISYHPVGDEGNELYEPFVGELYAIDENDNVYYEPLNAIYFKEPITIAQADTLPKIGDIYAFGVRGYEVIDLIIINIQPGQNLTAALTCAEYSPEIFGVDDENFTLPDFINRITPVTSAIDHGNINPNNWRRFAVFHDDEEEPPRPAGDGQSSGWYNEQTFRSLWQSTKTAETIDSGEWGLPVRIRAQRGMDDVISIHLGLTPQNITLETDGSGNILAGVLQSTTVQALLLQWNAILSNVNYSLTGVPAGVSINQNGLVTFADNTVLGENNVITVNAEYQGTVYSSAFTIKKNVRSSPPTYLGTITVLPAAAPLNKIMITGPGQAREVFAIQGDYVLSLAAIGERKAGSVFQWTGIAWEYRDAVQYTDMYTRCFKDGLEVLATNTEWFGAVFAARIVAMDAFIEKLQTQLIELQKGGQIKSAVFSETKGFQIVGDTGEAIFNDIKIRGSGIFSGKLEAAGGTFTGDLSAAGGSFKGTLLANSIVMDGEHKAGDKYLITEDNFRIIDRRGDQFRLQKTLLISGKGACRIKYRLSGEMQIFYRNPSGTWNYFYRNHQSMTDGYIDDVQLYYNTNAIHLFGRLYDYGGGFTVEFDNTIFQAWCLEDPGIFKYMSFVTRAPD